MWKRGGRSSALGRGQALLSAKKHDRGDIETRRSTDITRKYTGGVDGSLKTRPPAPNAHMFFSDLSDLSSVSSARDDNTDASEKSPGRGGVSSEGLRPQGSLGGGGGSRFLKKAPPLADSNQSTQRQQVSESRYASGSQRGSQTAAMIRLAQIESRFRSRKQDQPRLPVSTSVPVSGQTNTDQSLKGKRFLKNKAAVVVDGSNTAASGSPVGPDVGVRSMSRAAGTTVSAAGLEKKSLRIVSGVSLESDEEDMRKLLGDSMDSTDNSLIRPARTADKILSKSKQKIDSTPPPAKVAPPRSSVSPSRHSSPFRFTGQVQAQFSPSVLSPSPSPPRVSPSPFRTTNSPYRAGSPQRSVTSVSGQNEVLSLEELFPVGPDSEEPHSEMSFDCSEDFKMNVMTLDDLVPAASEFTEERKEREAKYSAPVPGSSVIYQQLPRLSEEEKEEQQQQVEVEEEDVLDYQSDFESESRTDPDQSASQVSEHLQRDGVEVVSEVREGALNSDVSPRRTEDNYSSTFSDRSSYTSDHSQTSESFSRHRDSRASVSNGSRASHHQARGSASARRTLKEVAVQTQPDTMAYIRPTGAATFEHPLTYMNPILMAASTLSADRVEALSSFSPSAFAHNEILKQQLAMTRRFIESSRQLHSRLVQSLEPPNYRYTTLQDTKEYIRKHRSPKLTMEETLEKVQQEMRDHLCV